MNISSKHSNLNFLTILLFYWLLQNGANKNQHQESYWRETIHGKFVFCAKLVRQKKLIGEQNTCIYACEICAEGIFGVFSLATKIVKSRSKYLLFLQMSAILKFDFQKRKQLHFS